MAISKQNRDKILMELHRQFRADSSALFLLISNLITIFLAVYERWDLSEIMWIYWGQSVIIGYFNRKRILGLKEFSTSGFHINDQPVKPTKKTQKTTATFFAIHYGLFHLVFCFFVWSKTFIFQQHTNFYSLMCSNILF